MDDVLSRLRSALAGRYTLERELGRGGMATVWLARDEKHDRLVALKVLRPELAAALGPERFLREIQIAARLTHPHILPLHDSGDAGGFLFYVMPYVEGESLRDRLFREKQLPVDDALQIAREVADALSYAHSHDVVHRDIKPENILLEAGHAVVADFGIARAITAAGGEKLTATGIAVGTPPYMSPEQAAGSQDLDGRSDLYSLGCVLFEMLAGRPPFVGPTAENVVHQHLTAEVPAIASIRPAVPAAVAAALSRALAKTPADRFNPVALFGEALRVPTSTGTGMVGTGRKPRPWRWAVAAVAVLVLGLGSWILTRGRREPPVPSLLGPPRAYTIVAAVDGSADPEVRKTVRTVIMTALDQSGVVAPLPDDQVRQGLELAGRPDTTTLTEALARELAVRGSIRAVVAASVDRVGQVYHVAIRAITADSGTTIVTERGVARSDDELIPTLDGVVQTLRQALGERGAAVAATRAVMLVATHSLAAYQAFRRGWGFYEEGDYAHALPAFKEAVRTDPDFGEAWRSLAVTYRNVGFADSALPILRNALQRPTVRLTERDRHMAEGVAAQYAGDRATALVHYERAVREFGGSPVNLLHSLDDFGRTIEGVELLQSWIRSKPFGGSTLEWGALAGYLATLGRVDEAREAVTHMSGQRGVSAAVEVETAAANWSTAESLATSIIAQEMPRTRRAGVLSALASAQAAHGRVSEAFASLLALGKLELTNTDVHYDAPQYYRLAILGVVAGARRGESAWTVSVDVSAVGLAGAALWAAALGDTASARHLLVRARTKQGQPQFPVADTVLMIADAMLAGRAGRWDDALRLLRPLAARTRFVSPPTNQLTQWLTGHAYERLGHPDSARAHFEKLTAWEGFNLPEQELRGLTHSFAHQRLVVLYAQMGRVEEARRHWKIFSETFTNPDPEVRHLVDEAREALAEAERRGG